MELLAWAILGTLTTVGLILLAIGLRGRRVNDHPHCRACGFDLFGTPNSPTCPECGINVQTTDAVRIGERRRHRGSTIAGLVLLSLASIEGGSVAWFWASGYDWQRVKPVWWLIHDLDSTDAPTAAAAVAEFQRRLTAIDLSQTNIDALVRKVLQVQVDLNRPWTREWGDLVETAHTAGFVDDESWHRYLEQGVVVDVQIRPIARAGASFPIRTSESGRFGKNDYWLKQTRNQCVEGFNWFKRPDNSTVLLKTGRAIGGTHVCPATVFTGSALPPGNYVLVLRTDYSIRNYGTREVKLHKWTRTWTERFQITPTDIPTVRVNNDPRLQLAVEAAVSIDSLTVQPQGQYDQVDSDFVDVTVARRPISIAYDVYVDDKEGPPWKLGRFAVFRLHTTTYRVSKDGGDDPVKVTFAHPTVDLIFKPSVSAAEATVDITEIYGGEVIIRDVPVKYEQQ